MRSRIRRNPRNLRSLGKPGNRRNHGSLCNRHSGSPKPSGRRR
jgi:hypothetical protein